MINKSIEKKKREPELKESAARGVLKRFYASKVQEKRDGCSVMLTFDNDQQLKVVFETEEAAVQFQDSILLWNKRDAITGVELVYRPKEKPKQYTVCVLVASLRLERVFDSRRKAIVFMKTVERMMNASYYHERTFTLTGYGYMYDLCTDKSFKFACFKSKTKIFF